MEPRRYRYIEHQILKLILQLTPGDPSGYPATVPSLLTLLQQRLPSITNITNQELVDALKRLRPKYLTLWKWSDEVRRFIEYPSEISDDGNFFYRGDFRLRQTPDTDPQAQELEAFLQSEEHGKDLGFRKGLREMYNKDLASAILSVLDEIYPDAIDLTQIKARLPQFSSLDEIDWSKAMKVLYDQGRVKGHPITADQFEYPVDWRDIAITQQAAKPVATPLGASSSVLVLISHSGKDVSLATAVTEFLRAGLALRPEQIRCSSVDGYRLPAGVHTEDQLRAEVNSTKALIGLITPNSLASPYVLFELGARWGAKLPMLPLLSGVKPEEVRGPLSSLNALSSSSASQLHQLLTDVSNHLNLPVQSAASYQRYLEAVIREAEAVGTAPDSSVSSQKKMVFEESVYWKRDNEGREGPYCPTCYDDKKKEIHLNPGATKGTFTCGVCHNNFTTSEYDPKPGRISPVVRRYTRG